MTDSDNIDDLCMAFDHAEILIDCDKWHDCDKLQNALETVLNTVLSGEENVSILLTDDDRIRQLNNDFRSKDTQTNVLSFPSGDDLFLGDIAISFTTLHTEADLQDKEFYAHFMHILIHGILHLLGYDHIDDDEAEEMEAVEIKLLEDMGIKNPYI